MQIQPVRNLMVTWQSIATLRLALTKQPLCDFKMQFNEILESVDETVKPMHDQAVFVLGGCSITQGATKKLPAGTSLQSELFAARKFWTDAGVEVPKLFTDFMAFASLLIFPYRLLKGLPIGSVLCVLPQQHTCA